MSDGLENVVAAETVLSDVDGQAGRLVIRGKPLEALAGHLDYEDVLDLLWGGFFQDLPRNLKRCLGEARLEVFQMLAGEMSLLSSSPVFESIRALMARLPDRTSLDTAVLLAAAPGALLPSLIRLKQGRQPVAPDPHCGHAEDMLRMLIAGSPEPTAIAAFNAYLVTVADHGLNASTFAARVVASTQAGLNSCVLAAMGALSGPLHGGAPGPVLDMLDAIAAHGDPAAWIDAELIAGRRLMGFGHRIYRVRDPRADALRAALVRITKGGATDNERLDFVGSVEAAALAALRRHKPDRALETNVEFYTALLLDELGFPRDAFTAVFASGRVGGWIAHSKEQAASGRLIRPKSLYVGPPPNALG